MAMFLGYRGRIGSYDFYIAPGASAMLRELGILLYLA
jgi:uncharacterized transporter YbjL